MLIVTIILFVSALFLIFDLPFFNKIIPINISLLPLYFFVIFSGEIKRSIWARTRERLSFDSSNKIFAGTTEELDKCITMIIKALQSMSKKNVGALIIVTPSHLPMQIIESGVLLESELSIELIENIFTPNTPLHDGAVVISGSKITAAGCFLPLSQDTSIPKDLGTRHRAGIGITEMTDVLSLIVSEETGVISVSRGGKLTRYADVEVLRESLEQIYGLKETR